MVVENNGKYIICVTTEPCKDKALSKLLHSSCLHIYKLKNNKLELLHEMLLTENIMGPKCYSYKNKIY